MERRYGQAFQARHLTGGIEAEDSIRGTRQFSRGQGEAHSFSPCREGLREAMNQNRPDAFLVVVDPGARPVQYVRIKQGPGVAVVLPHPR
ncbi:hypothetical protein GCM10009712_03370 [Pseudarthrobacter sulfonivorans]